MDDLVAKVLAAISEAEDAEVHYEGCAVIRHGHAEVNCDCTATAALRRRCAKDREIVGRYIDADSKCKRYMSIEKDVTLPIEERQRASNSRDMWGAVAGALFRVVLDLAEGYGIEVGQ